MNELKVTAIPKNAVDPISVGRTLARPIGLNFVALPSAAAGRPVGAVDEHKLLPLHENKLAAEKTKDMFLGGQMCE